MYRRCSKGITPLPGQTEVFGHVLRSVSVPVGLVTPQRYQVTAIHKIKVLEKQCSPRAGDGLAGGSGRLARGEKRDSFRAGGLSLFLNRHLLFFSNGRVSVECSRSGGL